MKFSSLFSRLRRTLPVAALVASGAFAGANSSIVRAQASGSGMAMPAQGATQDPKLTKEIADLRAQVARLQAALDQRQSAPPAAGAPAQPPASGMQMGEMGGMGRMPPDGMPKGEMGAMPPGGMGMGMMDMSKGEMGMPPDGMKMPDGMMMDGMGRMGSAPAGAAMAPGAPPGAPPAGNMPPSGGMKMGGATAAGAPKTPRSMSSLPGVPGLSHAYHIGSTGFFLDQKGITFTTDQQVALNRIKERALLERGNAERRVAQAEQELWVLTGADQPDALKVQAKAREIEQVRSSQRIAFIQAVGEATTVLTPAQRAQLMGTTPVK